jgi:hypothetical protein
MINFILFNPPVATVKFDTGELYHGNATEPVIQFLANNRDLSYEQALLILNAEAYHEYMNKKRLKELLETSDKFELKEGSIYIKGLPFSLPQFLVEQLLDTSGLYYNEESIRNFWKWSSLIKDAKSRDSLFQYIYNNRLKILPNGFFLATRRVKTNWSELDKFVYTQYRERRRLHRSTNVVIWKVDGEYKISNEIIEGEFIGNLYSMYKSLPPRFKSVTLSSVTRQPLYFDFGVTTSENPEDVDWNPDQQCGAGIHVHNGAYNDSGYGDTRVLCLINPADVVACPLNDNSKMRVLSITLLKESYLTPLLEEISETEQKIIDRVHQEALDNLENLQKSADLTEYTKYHTDLDTCKNVFDVILNTTPDLSNKLTQL